MQVWKRKKQYNSMEIVVGSKIEEDYLDTKELIEL